MKKYLRKEAVTGRCKMVDVKWIWLLILSFTFYLLPSTCLYAAPFSKDAAGTSGAQFLKLGAGARATAMGNAFAGIADDSTALYWNPAGLNQVKKQTLVVAHNIMFEDIYYDWVSYSKPVDKGVIGVGVQYLSYGKIKEMDVNEIEIGNFQPNDLAVTIGYARMFGKVMAGLNLKYISSTIKYTATAMAFDAGGLYKLNNKLSVAMVIQNVGTKLRFIDDEDTLPMNIKVGGAYKIMKNWVANADVNFPVDNQMNVCAGTEYEYKIGKSISAFGRLGYTTETKDVGGLNGVTGGVGGEYKDYSLDYAFVPFGDLGNTHRVSFGIKF